VFCVVVWFVCCGGSSSLFGGWGGVWGLSPFIDHESNPEGLCLWLTLNPLLLSGVSMERKHPEKKRKKRGMHIRITSKQVCTIINGD
jgi:hypothetical protein